MGKAKLPKSAIGRHRIKVQRQGMTRVRIESVIDCADTRIKAAIGFVAKSEEAATAFYERHNAELVEALADDSEVDSQEAAAFTVQLFESLAKSIKSFQTDDVELVDDIA